MFNKILIATDLSKASDEIVCTLASLKPLGTRQILLLECLNVRDVGGLAENLAEQITPRLEQQRDRVAALGFETEARTVIGLPHIEIEREAAEFGSSLIVIGSRGVSGFRELLLGSVASAVIHHSSHPVLVIPVAGGPAEEPPPCQATDCDYLRSVLVPTDFSDNAELAYGHVRELARRGARSITLLHVLPPDASGKSRALAESRLDRLSEDLRSLGAAEVSIEVVEGQAKKEVIDRTAAPAHSLVVVGNQGQGYVAGAMLGSVSHAVAYRSEIPVLFVPLPRN
ncbi:MAG: universal stress protein [Verrucomicrobiales bacterium]